MKFLYPGGQLEIIDCTWIAIVPLGASGNDVQSPWIVLRFEGREIWKPLGYLVQAEVLEANPDRSSSPEELFTRATEDLGYHR